MCVLGMLWQGSRYAGAPAERSKRWQVPQGPWSTGTPATILLSRVKRLHIQQGSWSTKTPATTLWHELLLFDQHAGQFFAPLLERWADVAEFAGIDLDGDGDLVVGPVEDFGHVAGEEAAVAVGGAEVG